MSYPLTLSFEFKPIIYIYIYIYQTNALKIISFHSIQNNQQNTKKKKGIFKE